MVELGLNYGQGPLLLKKIAKREEISEKYLSQIIIPLRASGLVNSFRGAHGGYVLARPPEEITLKDIVGVLEGNFNLVGCIKNPSECSRVSVCVTRGLWDSLGKKIAQILEAVTLADLVKQCKEKRQDTFMYNI
jgi:Rrf2 family protein